MGVKGIFPRIAIAAMLMLAGLIATASPGAAQTTVRFGSVGGITDAGLFIAQRRGYFKEAGLEVEMIRMNNGTALSTALASNQLDVAGISVAPAIYAAIAQGLKIVIVGDKQSRKPGISATQFVVRPALLKDSKEATIKALKGKKIGVSSTRSVSFMQVENLMELYGLPAGEVEYVQIEYQNMVTALANGAIDAAQIIEPFLTQAIDRNAAVIVSDMIEARGDIGTATTVPIVYSERFASNRDIGVAFMVAYMRGVRDYIDALEKKKDRDRIYTILAEETHFPVGLVARMHLPYLDPNQRIDAHAFEELQKYYVAKGWVKKPVEIARLVDPSFAEAAVKMLGEYR